MTSRLRSLVLVGALVASALVVASGSGAEAQEHSCQLDPITLQCRVGVPIERPTTPGTEQPEQPGRSGTGRPTAPPPDPGSGNVRATCDRWIVESGPAADAYLASINAPAGYVAHVCVEGERQGQRAAFAPGEAPTPPSAEELAADLWAEVQATMTAPTVAADPPVGTPSLVTLPVFVEVTNWQGTQTDSVCELGVCVSITATPTLLLYSGETDSSPVVCDPPGTRFDPDGAEPDVQATAPGACAYVYTRRSGVEGRPDAWPAEVRVVWEVRWTGAGQSGEFDPMTLATAIPRQVSEVQTVVVDGSTE